MLWDYIEMNPLTHPSGWFALLEDSISNIAHLTRIPPVEDLPQVKFRGFGKALRPNFHTRTTSLTPS
jgi:hypothetical protein